jgi:ABC-type uncharacterized transport system YnjBCD ATPase subunit
LPSTNLKIASGEFFSLLGPSGCGKTTTLRMLAGFVTPDDGRILIDSDDITEQPPEKRNIGIVFQNYAIFPHMNVAENIAFGLRMRKVERGEIERRVTGALQQVGLKGFEARYQRELSGGEQQRVALARVLVTRPRIILVRDPSTLGSRRDRNSDCRLGLCIGRRGLAGTVAQRSRNPRLGGCGARFSSDPQCVDARHSRRTRRSVYPQAATTAGMAGRSLQHDPATDSIRIRS